MRLPRVQFTIRRTMTVIAVAAGLCAWLRVPSAVALTAIAILILAPTLLALFTHIIVARPGYRLLVAAWVASLWPVLLFWSIHTAWVIAYGFLGHRPGLRDRGWVIGMLGQSVLLVIILAMVSPIACLLLTLVPREKPVAVGGHSGVSPVGWALPTIPLYNEVCGAHPTGLARKETGRRVGRDTTSDGLPCVSRFLIFKDCGTPGI